MSKITAWIPETDPKTLALIGKLGEEAAELAKACIRAQIMGLQAIDPDNGFTNEVNIIRELDDCKAVYKTLFDLSMVGKALTGDQFRALDKRLAVKVAGFHEWMGLIDEHYALRDGSAGKTPFPHFREDGGD